MRNRGHGLVSGKILWSIENEVKRPGLPVILHAYRDLEDARNHERPGNKGEFLSLEAANDDAYRLRGQIRGSSPLLITERRMGAEIEGPLGGILHLCHKAGQTHTFSVQAEEFGGGGQLAIPGGAEELISLQLGRARGERGQRRGGSGRWLRRAESGRTGRGGRGVSDPGKCSEGKAKQR